jgi:hypothetical protein
MVTLVGICNAGKLHEAIQAHLIRSNIVLGTQVLPILLCIGRYIMVWKGLHVGITLLGWVFWYFVIGVVILVIFIIVLVVIHTTLAVAVAVVLVLVLVLVAVAVAVVLVHYYGFFLSESTILRVLLALACLR